MCTYVTTQDATRRGNKERHNYFFHCNECRCRRCGCLRTDGRVDRQRLGSMRAITSVRSLRHLTRWRVRRSMTKQYKNIRVGHDERLERFERFERCDRRLRLRERSERSEQSEQISLLSRARCLVFVLALDSHLPRPCVRTEPSQDRSPAFWLFALELTQMARQ